MSSPLCLNDNDWCNENWFHYTEKPVSIRQALVCMEGEKWEEMCSGLGVSDVDEIMELIRETNTCTAVCFPCEVWIDLAGVYTITVYGD